MMFDNSSPPTPSRWQQVKDHVPIALVALGVLALFVSLHTGAVVVAAFAVGHVMLGLLGALGTWLYRRRSTRVPQ